MVHGIPTAMLDAGMAESAVTFVPAMLRFWSVGEGEGTQAEIFEDIGTNMVSQPGWSRGKISEQRLGFSSHVESAYLRDSTTAHGLCMGSCRSATGSHGQGREGR